MNLNIESLDNYISPVSPKYHLKTAIQLPFNHYRALASINIISARVITLYAKYVAKILAMKVLLSVTRIESLHVVKYTSASYFMVFYYAPIIIYYYVLRKLPDM